MEVGRFIRKQAQAVVWPILLLTLSAYFAYNMVEGDRGLLAWLHSSHQLEMVQAQADTVRTQKETLEHRVFLLQDNHLGPDLLDEQARAALNLAGPHQIVIMNNDDQK
jgi:cell division protein FtsB